MCSCSGDDANSPSVSFYYWKRNYALGDNEKKCLAENSCAHLYVRYFDLVKEGSIKPVSIIDFKEAPQQKVTPVIFIKNEVFLNLAPAETDSLASRVFRLIYSINKVHRVKIADVQFDCDWSHATKLSYFHFLESFHRLTGLSLSATIRLHQVKYKQNTGVPPVKKGVLMFYNIGKIAADSTNSIYDKRLAEKYTPWLRDYSLPLDIALPVFSWGIHVRGKEIIGLLNKEINNDMTSDTSFAIKNGHLYKIKNDGFKNGFYFKANDQIKIEKVAAAELLQIAGTLKNCMPQPAEILFYDLDGINLKKYDKEIFKQVRNCFN